MLDQGKTTILHHERPILTDEHRALREAFGAFLDRSVEARYRDFEVAGQVPRDLWTEAGGAGFLAPQIPTKYGGMGTSDFRFNAVLNETLSSRGMRGFGLTVHNDVVLPYLLRHGTQEAKEKWLPGMATGETIAALALTEPDAGSDLAAIRTSARETSAGDGYIVNGQKTFISNGQLADIIITAVRTGSHPYRGLSLMVIEDQSGLVRGKPLEKIGIHAQDTSPLYFSDVWVPRRNLLGEVNRGFEYMMENLAQERLSIAISAVATAERILLDTIAFAVQRRMFGKRLADLQNTQFEIADMAARVRAMRVYVDDCILQHNTGELASSEAAGLKLISTELQVSVADRCVQLHGGSGYMADTPVARLWRDSRPATIYGGANEVMKHVLARTLLPREG